VPSTDFTPYYQPQTSTSDGSKFDNMLAYLQTILNGLDQGNFAAGQKRTISTIATGPPGSPADGDIWVATAVDANGVRWHFQYNAGSASAYKWEFIGGPAIAVDVVTGEATASATNVDLATVQSFTLPRAGDWDVLFGATTANTTAATNNFTTLTIAGTELALALCTASQGGASQIDALAHAVRLTGRFGADVLKQQYRTSAGSATFRERYMRITPVRVS
jgi:hypothetical protein